MTSNIDLSSLTSQQGILFNLTNIYSSIAAVSGNLDINGDGLSDTLLLTNRGESSLGGGAVFVVFGNKTPSSFYNINNLTPPSIKLYNSDSYYFFCSVSSAGDVNKDGFDDFITGIYGSGFAYLVLGNKTMPSTIQTTDSKYVRTISGFNNGNSYSSVTGGDFNGDNYSDFVVCAQGSSNACYIYFGKQNMPTQINLSTMGTGGVKIAGSYTTGPTQTGIYVSSAGDVNNDKITDLLIATGSGTTYLIWGSKSFPTTINLNSLGSYGIVIQPSGPVGSLNFNGDTFSDIAVGTTIIYGNASLPSSIDLNNLGNGGVAFTIETTNPCGSSVVAGVGDLNNDGFDEFAIGCPGLTEDTPGGVAVFYGGKNIPSNIYINDLGNLAPYNGYYISGYTYKTGSSVANAGNFTGSKFNSMIMNGPPYYDSGNTTAYLLYGAKYDVPLTTYAPSMAPTAIPTNTPTITPSSHTPTISGTTAIPTTNSPTTIEPTAPPTPSPSKGNDTSESNSNSEALSNGALAVISAGSIIGGLIALAGIGYLVYKNIGPLLIADPNHQEPHAHGTEMMNIMHAGNDYNPA